MTEKNIGQMKRAARVSIGPPIRRETSPEGDIVVYGTVTFYDEDGEWMGGCDGNPWFLIIRSTPDLSAEENYASVRVCGWSLDELIAESEALVA